MSVTLNKSIKEYGSKFIYIRAIKKLCRIHIDDASESERGKKRRRKKNYFVLEFERLHEHFQN